MDEEAPLLESFQERSRQGRGEREKMKLESISICILKTVFCTSGYWTFSRCCFVYILLLLMLTCFQLVYDIFMVCDCPYFDCRFLAVVNNNTKKNPTRSLQNATYTTASCGGFFSYTLMLLSLYVMHNKKLHAVRPKTMGLDLGRCKTLVLTTLLSVLIILYCFSVAIFFYFTRSEAKDRKRYSILAMGVGSQFITQWTGIVACFVFGVSALSLGRFATDMQRRINSMKGENINTAIKIHREFATIVRDTVASFSIWFVVHWFLYGLTTIIALLVVVKKLGNETVLWKKIYISLFLVVHLLMFVLPCAFAAYITSVGGAIPGKLNNTTDEDWPDGHLFKNREKLQLFVSYARESSVGFKIGRITFTSTLAWASFFFGFSGLLLKFFA